MSESDRNLINKAFQASEWNELKDREKQAESTEAKQILHDRKIHLYRKEEAFSDQL